MVNASMVRGFQYSFLGIYMNKTTRREGILFSGNKRPSYHIENISLKHIPLQTTADCRTLAEEG